MIDDEKIEAIKKWPKPTKVRHIPYMTNFAFTRYATAGTLLSFSLGENN